MGTSTTSTIFRHICSLFYQLLLIILVSLIPCTLNVTNGVMASAVSSTSSSSPSMVNHDNNYDLHAHITIDSIKMTIDNGNDLSQLIFEPKFLNFDELSVGK